MTQFTFYTDPGHGWLCVSERDLADLGLSAADFSQYSRAKRGPLGTMLYYLEEDCDASIFVARYAAKHGEKPQFRDEYHERIFIRNLPPMRRGSRFDANIKALYDGSAA